MIKVAEIRAKTFAEVKKGYNVDEVDAYLSELADQTQAMAKEIITLQAQLKAAPAAQPAEDAVSKTDYDALTRELEALGMENEKLKAQLEKAETQPRQSGAFEDPAVLKELEAALRETVINAQRNAEKTQADAEASAAQIIADAEAKAAEVKAESDARLAEITAQYDHIKELGKSYSAGFVQLIEAQRKLLDESPLSE